MGIGSGKKEKTTADFMKTFEKYCNSGTRDCLINIEMLFSDETFLFSNLIMAVFLQIFATVFGGSYCPLGRIQLFMTGDPFQLLVYDKDKSLNKNKCCFIDVHPFETTSQKFSMFFERLMATGLRVLIVSKVYRATDALFLETCHEVFCF